MSEYISPAVVAKAVDDLIAENNRLNHTIREMQTRTNVKKLDARDAAHIRDLKRAGYSQKEIAESFDLNPATVSRIVRGLYHG